LTKLDKVVHFDEKQWEAPTKAQLQHYQKVKGSFIFIHEQMAEISIALHH
jgi:hypothetical protein